MHYFCSAMAPFLNIHTHHADARTDVYSVLCCEPSVYLSSHPDTPSVSIGHHPWNVGDRSSAELTVMAQTLQQKQIVAVGEIGLDKVCDADFNMQKELFKTQLRMAACVQKPVIVHCVKAWEDFQSIIGQVDNLPPVIIHGFRGKPQLAQQLLMHGVYLSFGTRFNEDTLVSLPLGSFFIETDDEDADIQMLYSQISDLRGVGLESLKTIIWEQWLSLQPQTESFF